MNSGSEECLSEHPAVVTDLVPEDHGEAILATRIRLPYPATGPSERLPRLSERNKTPFHQTGPCFHLLFRPLEIMKKYRFSSDRFPLKTSKRQLKHIFLSKWKLEKLVNHDASPQLSVGFSCTRLMDNPGQRLLSGL